MGADDDVLLGQHGYEGNRPQELLAGTGNALGRIDTVFAEAPSETEGASVLSPALISEVSEINGAYDYATTPISDEEIYVGLTSEIEASKLMLVKMAEDGDFRGAGVLSETIMGLEQQKESLYEFLRKQNITPEDILFVRQQIPGYTSVLNLTEEQKAACVKLEQLFDELGDISPFVRRENDVLEHDQTRVPVLELKDVFGGSTDVGAIAERSKNDMKKLQQDVCGRGYINTHTNWEINVVRRSIEETFISAVRISNRSKNPDSERLSAQLSTMYSLDSLTKHAVLLDSVLTDMHGAKYKNSMFMHHLYCPYQFNERLYIAELSVEHGYIPPHNNERAGEQKRLYHVKGVKVIPAVTPHWILLHGETAGIVPETKKVFDTISISELHQIVKDSCKEFYKNEQSQNNGRAVREVEIYNQARYADAQAALDAEAETIIPRETVAAVETYALPRQITPEDAAEQLSARSDEQEKLRPITSEVRSRILGQFAAENGLPKVFVYRANKAGKSSPREYYIGAKENSRYVIREPLFTLQNGEVFSEKALVAALEKFKRSASFTTRPQQVTLFDNQQAPEGYNVSAVNGDVISIDADGEKKEFEVVSSVYAIANGTQEEHRIDNEIPAIRDIEKTFADSGVTAQQAKALFDEGRNECQKHDVSVSIGNALNAKIVDTLTEKIPQKEKAFLLADDNGTLADGVSRLVGRYAVLLRGEYGDDTPEYAHLTSLTPDSQEAQAITAEIVGRIRTRDVRVTNDTEPPLQKRPYAVGDAVWLQNREFRIAEIGNTYKPAMDELDRKFLNYGRSITLEDKSIAGWYPITRSMYQAELEHALALDVRNAGYDLLGSATDEPVLRKSESPTEKEKAFPQEYIDHALRRGSGIQYGKFRIYEQFSRNNDTKENVAFLSKEYGIGGCHPAYGIGVGWGYDGKGITVTHGDADKRQSRTLLTWTQTAKRISELIATNDYFVPNEKSVYPAWLAHQEKIRAEQTPETEQVAPIQLVQLGDFYEAYDKDAHTLSTVFGFTVLERDGRDTVGFPSSKLDENVAILVNERGLKVDISHAPEQAKAIADESVRVTNDTEPTLQERVTNDTEPTLQERVAEIEQALRNSDIAPRIEEEGDEPTDLGSDAPAVVTLDNNEYLRDVLNEFSLRHGLGELYIEQGYHADKIVEKLKNGKEHLIGEIEAVANDVPHTPDSLKVALKAFEENTPDLSSRYGRTEMTEKLGGITPLPSAQKNLPEIVYANNPNGRFWNNIGAIKELNRLERLEDGDCPLYDKYNTKEDSEARLSKYCGWGGLSQVFDENNSAWAQNRVYLKRELSPEDYKKARASTLDSFYTPQIVVDAMYAAIKKMDLPQNAHVLEPSCGTGNFIRRMPSGISDSKIVGVEIDNLTARIAKRINENATIIHSGFEETNLHNNSFDLAIGNVPFGDYNLNDRDYSQNWRIHDAFFRKALDKVAPGGVVAFVTSSGTLDKSSPKVREYLAERAELIGAVRLPNNAFSNAGTKVTSDIVFLKKRETPLEKGDKKPDWCYTVANADGLRINSYFVQNPQMILGKMEKTSHFDMLTCVPEEGANLQAKLNAAIRYINAKVTISKRKTQMERQSERLEPWGKNFSFSKGEDGKIYYREADRMVEQKGAAPRLQQLEKLCEMRTVARSLIEAQKTASDDVSLKPMRDILSTLYDDYREKYGHLNVAGTQRIFGDDSDFPILLGLETYQKETGKWVKADIFSKRTVNPQIEITSAKNVAEALQISLDRRGKPDIAYITALVDTNYPNLPTKEICERVCAELLESGAVFVDPVKQTPGYPYSGIVERAEYLSGNVREKLSVAEQAKLTNNIEALKSVIPMDIKAEEITVRMGTPWIESDDYTAFLRHLSGRNYSHNQRKCDVHYSTTTGDFDVMNAGGKKGLNPAESTVYGTKDFSMYQLAEKLLNQRRIVVKREIVNPKDPEKTKTITDSKATRAALEKAKSIKAEFQKWIFSNETRKAYYERKYNDTFNCLVGRAYDGTNLTFAGMNSDFILRDHQKNAIARTVSGGNTLAAHVVGAGKSAVIFASIMRKKELGLINKACVVVPKALTEQTANEWRRLYPDAKILTVTAKDLNNEQKRKLFTARVATGSYDAVILSREQFEKIPMSNERRIAYLEKEYHELTDMLNARKRENGGRRDVSVKELEKAKKRLQSKLDNLINPKGKAKEKDNLLEFEHLGFDFLAVDEAHAYKNGFVVTKMTDVAGVTTRPSGRAEDMQMKCDFLNEEFGQGHILMATGTPVSNSMTELYVMTRYLRPDLLEKAGVSRFDDWAATFGNVTTSSEPTAYDTYKLKTRFAQFANLPELMALYKEFADIKSAQSLNLPRPKLEGGKNTIVNVPASPEQKEYIRQLAERAEAINAGTVEPYEDNFLKITGEARLVGLGNQAVKALYEKSEDGLPPEFTEQKNGKVDKCIDNVYEIWSEKTATNGVQIIFSDIAINDDGGNFSAYKYIKSELMDRGIPEKEIVFAPKADSNNREEIFAKINSGEYRVVIASTETLGTGANIQKKLCALHHLDIPWKPSCFEQREGRILRQGNENESVKIFNYVTKGTLDSYLYSAVTNKARFIAQLLDNESPARVCEDCDEKVLTYAEIQAVSAGNPDIKKQIETANRLAELRMLKREWAYEISRLKSQTESLPVQLKELEQRLLSYKADNESATSFGALTVTTKSGGRLDTNGAIDRLMHEKVIKALSNYDRGIKTPTPIGNVGGFELSVIAEPSFGTNEKQANIIIKGEATYRIEAGIAETGNTMRLKNFFLGNRDDGKPSVLDRRVSDTTNKIEELYANLEQAKEAVVIPFAYTEELIKTEEELAALEEKLSGITEQEDVVGIDSNEMGDEFDETKEQNEQRKATYSSEDENDYEPVPDEDNTQTRGGR